MHQVSCIWDGMELFQPDSRLHRTLGWWFYLRQDRRAHSSYFLGSHGISLQYASWASWVYCEPKHGCRP